MGSEMCIRDRGTDKRGMFGDLEQGDSGVVGDAVVGVQGGVEKRLRNELVRAEVDDGDQGKWALDRVAQREVGQAAEGGGEAGGGGQVLEEELLDGGIAVGGGEVHERVDLVELHVLRRREVVVGGLAAQVPEEELVADGVGVLRDCHDLRAGGGDALPLERVGGVQVVLVGDELGSDDLVRHTA